MSEYRFKSKLGTYVLEEGKQILRDETGRPVKDEAGEYQRTPSCLVEHKTDLRKKAEKIIAKDLDQVVDVVISTSKLQLYSFENRENSTRLKTLIEELLKECTVTVQASKQINQVPTV